MFDSAKGKLYSYAYRIAYLACIHYYENIRAEQKKQSAIEHHCKEELREYFDHISDHKTTAHRGEL